MLFKGIQNILEISASTLSEILKTLNAHNFINSYQKILILHFKKIAEETFFVRQWCFAG